MRLPSIAICLASACLGIACAEPKSATPTVASASSSSAPAASASSTGSGAATGDAGTAGDASGLLVDATVDAGVEDVAPALYEGDGAPLGQTDAFPSIDSASYRVRVDLLWRAIVEDDPEVAMPCFFPLVAYEQVKAIPKPAIDWKNRLIAAFVRDLHADHKKLGADAQGAKLVGLEVPVDKAKWMAPGSEGNKLGYDRVLHSTLAFTRADGTAATLDVASMISWRGEWYVVHLAGFK